MKKALLSILIISFTAVGLSARMITSKKELKKYYRNANNRLLPKNFPVWVGKYGVINVPARGYKKTILPTRNAYRGKSGCYIACYSRKKSSSIYPVGGGIYVMGQVRVKGKYNKRICLPKGHESSDISAMKKFKNICKKNIPSCKSGGCWAGGDTGGWYGLQSNGTVNVKSCSRTATPKTKYSRYKKNR